MIQEKLAAISTVFSQTCTAEIPAAVYAIFMTLANAGKKDIAPV
jgi:hypothetical protein